MDLKADDKIAYRMDGKWRLGRIVTIFSDGDVTCIDLTSNDIAWLEKDDYRPYLAPFTKVITNGKQGFISASSPELFNDGSFSYRVAFIDSSNTFLYNPNELQVVGQENKDSACNCSSFDLLHTGHKCGLNSKKFKQPGE